MLCIAFGVAMNASFLVAFHLVDGLVTADIVVSSIGVDVFRTC